MQNGVKYRVNKISKTISNAFSHMASEKSDSLKQNSIHNQNDLSDNKSKCNDGKLDTIQQNENIFDNLIIFHKK